MAQRCSYCGRTKKQHEGRACIDVAGFKKVLKEREMTFDMNPKDDEQDEEEQFVFSIAELIQAGKVNLAKVHLRSYIEHVRPENKELDRQTDE